ncbi:MAG: XdhC family protein [Solirubrobacteraceae bacterium]
MNDSLSDEQRQWEQQSEVHGPAFEPPGNLPPRLVIFGAVPLAAALCRAVAAIDWRVYVIDPRERFARAELFPDAERVVVGWPEEAFAELGACDETTAVVLLTHAPELDDPALMIALRSPAFYVGAMGSRRTQGRRRERLAQARLGESELARLSGPAGLDLGGVTAAEAALAILAEAVAALHGRDGARLTRSENAIHVAGRP